MEIKLFDSIQNDADNNEKREYKVFADKHGCGKLTISKSDYGLIAFCISNNECEEVVFLTKDESAKLAEYLQKLVSNEQ